MTPFAIGDSVDIFGGDFLVPLSWVLGAGEVRHLTRLGSHFPISFRPHADLVVNSFFLRKKDFPCRAATAAGRAVHVCLCVYVCTQIVVYVVYD